MQLFFEELGLSSMINLIESDDRLLRVANWGFRAKYGRMWFDISRPFTDDPNQFIVESSPIRRPKSDVIKLREFKTILKVLKYFGGSITKLLVKFEGMQVNQIQSINENISDFCTKLSTFDLRNGEETDINQLRPILTVQNVSIATIQLEKIGELLERNFPNVKCLNVKTFQVSNSQCLARYFPSLEHLDVSFFMSGFQVADIEAVVKMNPQIRSLRLHMCPTEFMKVIKDYLPNSESLALIWPLENFFQTNAEVVHFENMKKFTIDGRFKLVEFPFSFNPEKLKELRIGCLAHFNDKWIDFMVQHKQMTKLEITRTKLNEIQLMRLADEITNLKTFTADFGAVTEIVIVEFLERCRNLHQLKLLAPKQQIMEELNRILIDEWEVYFDSNSEESSWIIKHRFM